MQSGTIVLRGNQWLLRYKVKDPQSGAWRSTAKVLARYSPEHRREADVRPLAALILAPVNAKTARIDSTDSLESFFDSYLENAKDSLKPSTLKTYTDLYKMCKPHLAGLRLSNTHTPEIDRLMKDATSDKQRAHTTHRNLKSFLSGAFKYAKRKGLVSENPVHDAAIPRGKPKGRKDAYTLDEVSTMLRVLPEPARTVVFTAALTGLRLSELKGLRWEDFDGDSVMIQRSVWQGKTTDTKTLASKAYVPVVPQLLEALAEHRARNSGTGFVFHGSTGQPLRLENVFRRDMEETLAKAKVNWRGWHPFRYGVGTTLRALGVDIKLIQQILRHSDQRLTMDFYVKPAQAETKAALVKLEKALGKSLARKRA